MPPRMRHASDRLRRSRQQNTVQQEASRRAEMAALERQRNPLVIHSNGYSVQQLRELRDELQETPTQTLFQNRTRIGQIRGRLNASRQHTASDEQRHLADSLVKELYEREEEYERVRIRAELAHRPSESSSGMSSGELDNVVSWIDNTRDADLMEEGGGFLPGSVKGSKRKDVSEIQRKREEKAAKERFAYHSGLRTRTQKLKKNQPPSSSSTIPPGSTVYVITPGVPQDIHQEQNDSRLAELGIFRESRQDAENRAILDQLNEEDLDLLVNPEQEEEILTVEFDEYIDSLFYLPDENQAEIITNAVHNVGGVDLLATTDPALETNRLVLVENDTGRVSYANPPGEMFGPDLLVNTRFAEDELEAEEYRIRQENYRQGAIQAMSHQMNREEEDLGGVGTLEMVYENRRTAIDDPIVAGNIFDATVRGLLDRDALGPDMWLRFYIQGRGDTNIQMNMPFQAFQFGLRQGWEDVDGWGDVYPWNNREQQIQLMRERFITYFLTLLNSPTNRVERDRLRKQDSGLMNVEAEVGDEFYEPMYITVDYVNVPPEEQLAELPQVAIQNIQQNQYEEDLHMEVEEGGVHNEEPLARRARRRFANETIDPELMDRLVHRRRISQRIQQLRGQAMGSQIDASGRRFSFRNKRVGGYLGCIEIMDFKGNYTLLHEQRDPLIYPPPPPQFRLSEATKKRRKQRHRKECRQVEKIVVNEMKAGVKVGAYEINNENELLFYKESIEHIYNRKGLLHLTPQTKSKSCFLMGLIRSECFQYEFNEQFDYIGKRRCGGNSIEEEEEQTFVIPCTLPEWNELDVHYSFVYYDEEEQNYQIRIMNRFISYDPETQKYQSELSIQEQYYWELAARELELYLLSRNEFLDVNDLESVAQTVSDVFQIVVSIYDVEYYGERVWCFQPKNKNISQVIREGGFTLRVVSMMYDRGHMYGISHLMKYLSQNVKNVVDLNAYCPFCEKRGTRELRKASTSLKHIQECWRYYRHRTPCMKLYTIQDHRQKQMEMGVIPVQMMYNVEARGKLHCCIYCYQPVPQEEYIFHQCRITCRRKKEILPKEQLYVYDLEAAQIPVRQAPGSYYHVCNMVCFRKMYPETEEEKRGFTFLNEYEFMDYVVKNLKDIVIIAHNGGSYDHQFVVRYLERLKIEHQFIPSPNSSHKFLSVHIQETNIQFLDFIYFLPGSLRSISDSMGIENGKGDFPHRFNTRKEIDYEGCIPPIETEEDYWCLKTKRSQKEVDEMKQFYQEQCEIYCTCTTCFALPNHTCLSCHKKTWVMKEIMEQYCMQDVIVLAQCCAKYREQLLEMREQDREQQTWNPINIDPFQYLTVPQLALNILISGYEESPFFNLKSKVRLGQCPEAIDWLERIMKNEEIHIKHRMNSTHEYFDYEIQQFADGYHVETQTCYVCLDCSIWGCENCHYHKMNHEPETLHPYFPSMNYQEVYEMTEGIIHQWQNRGAIVVRKCQIQRRDMTPYEQKCYIMHPMSTYFYGGRTEVFQLYYNSKATTDQKLQYHDVCSLYPYVCAFKELPNGEPQFILGPHIEPDRLFHLNRHIKYWGYISCRVKPNPDCLIGFLPSRKEGGRLQFSLEEQDGCWGLEELELAWRQGYQILEIYGIIHWDPDQRSDQLFRPYVDFFLRMKQESEGWKKLGASQNEPSEEEQDQIAATLFESNGRIGQIRKERVKKNPVKRMLAKLFLNSLWGKFAQKPESEVHTTIYGLKQFYRIWRDKHIIQSSIQFRQINSEIFKVIYEINNEYVRSNSRGNMALAAKVTEHARCELHKQMLRIGPERILYCDTDSLIFHWPKEGEDLTGIGLGKWTNEYPDDTIEEFYALAPKFYFLHLASNKHCLKIKGVQPILSNVHRLQRAQFRELLHDAVLISNDEKKRKEISMEYMTIYANCQRNLGIHYGVMMTRYGVKAARVMVTKRKIVKVESIDWNTLVQLKTTPLK